MYRKAILVVLCILLGCTFHLESIVVFALAVPQFPWHEYERSHERILLTDWGVSSMPVGVLIQSKCNRKHEFIEIVHHQFVGCDIQLILCVDHDAYGLLFEDCARIIHSGWPFRSMAGSALHSCGGVRYESPLADGMVIVGSGSAAYRAIPIRPVWSGFLMNTGLMSLSVLLAIAGVGRLTRGISRTTI
jgi:hypothetical protein